MKFYKKHCSLFMIVVFMMAFLQPDYSHAQNIFDKIFGRKEQHVTAPAPPTKRKIIRKQKPTQPFVQSPPKSADAKRILILGDFVASAAFDGLDRLYADNKDIVVLRAINGSSGIVRDDYYNWAVMIDKIITNEKPDIIIMTLGANDNQAIQPAKNPIIQSDKEWTIIYQKRLDHLTEKLKNTKKPWLWMGQPSFKNNQLNQNIIALNYIYKTTVEATGGRFVDIWDGFIDNEGKFALSGYDASGKTARLRANDGINFTSVGKQKLAFYLDKKLEPILNASFEETKKNVSKPQGQVFINLPHNITHIAPISIIDMAQDEKELLGQLHLNHSEKIEFEHKKNHDKPYGRADNFYIKP
ncbi:hypothetical protein MEG_01062 [Bartonella tamiae Th307]|nr:hypothetical protein MEG_01062 [Bartonella tamiae Th307]